MIIHAEKIEKNVLKGYCNYHIRLNKDLEILGNIKSKKFNVKIKNGKLMMLN